MNISEIVSDIIHFNYALLISYDVERVFLQYKNILEDNKRKFIIVKCNYSSV